MAGLRSVGPFSRREEGWELGEEKTIKKKVKEKESKIESVDVKSIDTKENPTHFKEVDGERFVEKSLSC
jgi:hypothetical protein